MMNYSPCSGGFSGMKRSYESDDDLIITNTRAYKRKSVKRPHEVDSSELPRLVGDSSLEMPALEDFCADGLDPTRFAWASKSAIIATRNALRGETPRPPRKAAPPSVPDPTDPDWNNEDKTNFNYRSRLRKKAPKSKPYVDPEDDYDIQSLSDSPLTPGIVTPTAVAPAVETSEKWVFPVPLELREMIYRNLLCSNKPIAVYDGWKKVYKHGNTRQTGPAFTDRPSLDINILGVNKLIYLETARILYGENTFLYRLRDPPTISSPPLDLDALISYDSAPSTNGSLEGDDPEDEDYQESMPLNNTRRARSMRKREDSSGSCINVNKFLHFYRHIIVEAEHNRSGDDTLRSMADAIKIFSSPSSVDKDFISLYPKEKRKAGRKETQSDRCEETASPMVIKPNIMTLVIKIRPSRTPTGFTFVNFFDTKSPIPQAILDLRPTQLYVKVMMGQLTQQRNGVSLPISFRHLRIFRLAASGVPDAWARDEEMIVRRKRKARESVRKLQDLSKNVQKFCNKYFIEHGKFIEEDDEFDLDWDEIDDDESDFDIHHATQTQVQVLPQAEGAPEASYPEVQDDITTVLQTSQTEETGIQIGEVMDPQTEGAEESVLGEVPEIIVSEVQQAVWDEAQNAMQHEHEEAVADETPELAQDETQGPIQGVVQDTVHHEAQDAMHHEAQDAIHREAQDAIHHEAEEAVAGETPEPAQDETQGPVQGVVQDTVQHDTQDAINHEAQDAIHHEAEEAVADETPEPAQDETQGPIQGVVQDTGQDETKEPMQDAVQDPVQSEIQDDFVMELQTNFSDTEGHHTGPGFIA